MSPVPECLTGVVSYCPVCKRWDFNHEHKEENAQ